jgi:hypothetical protein
LAYQRNFLEFFHHHFLQPRDGRSEPRVHFHQLIGRHIESGKYLSSMAELIGVVASGIAVATLAAQVVDNVRKLKAFWDSWEEAPKDLRCLADDIETLSVIVAVIRDDHSQHGGSFLPLDETFIGKSICLCQAAANRLNLVVSELESEIKGRGGKGKRFVWIRLALKRDKMASFATALESTKLTLILANQVYCQ